jgi:nucleotide-binding universal stress UspA family protein
VMGTNARSGVGRMVFGSVAEKVLRRSPVPVLTIGPHAQGEPGAPVKQILYTTNFSLESERAAAVAIRLAEEHQAKLTMLHVIETPKSGEFVRMHDLVDATTSRLRKLVTTEQAAWCEPGYLVEEGEPAECILNAAKKQHADLIVMGVKHAEGDLGHATHAPWPIAHRVLCEARCPVLTIRS